MTPDEYRAAYERLGLSQAGAGRFLANNAVTGPRASRHWAQGTVAVPHAVALMLRLMLRMKWTPEHVNRLARVDEERRVETLRGRDA